MGVEKNMAQDMMMQRQGNDDSDTMRNMFFIFDIENEEYGIEVAHVREILNISEYPITKVPQLPGYIEGIINMRGDLIGVLDVRKRFGKMPKEYDEQTCIVVISYNGYTLGLIVDGVRATQTIQPENISQPPSAKLNSYNQFIRNIGMVGNGVKLLMDLERFLDPQ